MSETGAAVQSSAPVDAAPVRPGRAKGLPGKEGASAAALFGVALASVLINVAQHHGSRQAERMANRVDRTELAPRFDKDALPEQTADGRTIPREPRLQVGNVLQKLWDRGQLPLPSTLGLSLSFATVKLVAMEIADLDQGVGCWMSLRKLEKKLNRDERTIREACEYLRDHVGMLLTFGRVQADDRKIGGATEPATEQRTTVRLMFPIPRPMAGRLSYEEVLDLIAAGERKAIAELADPGPEADPVGEASRDAPSATPRHAPRRAAVIRPASAAAAPAPDATPPPAAPASAEASPPTALLQVLVRIRELTGHELPASWVLERARQPDARLDADQTLEAMVDLATGLEDERSGMAAMGKTWRPPKGERLVARAAKYLTGKRIFIDKRGPEARATDASKEREASYRAGCKTPEQNFRESGQARHTAAPEDLQQTREQKEQLLRFEIENETDPAKKASLLARLHTFFPPSPAPRPTPSPALTHTDGLRLAYLGELATLETAELTSTADDAALVRKAELLAKLAALPPPPRGPPE